MKTAKAIPDSRRIVLAIGDCYEKDYMQEKDFLNHFLVVNAGLKITFGNHRHNLRKYGSAFVHTAHTIMS